MVCQMSPRMRCSFPSEISDELTLTTEQPIPLAEVMTMLLFCDLKSVEGYAGGRDVEYTGVDRVGDRVVDKFTVGQSVTTLVKELHRVCWDRETMADVGIIFDDLSRV